MNPALYSIKTVQRMCRFPLSLLCAFVLFPVSLAVRDDASHTNVFEQVEPAFSEKDYQVINGDLYEILPESQNDLQFENFSASKPMITTSNDRQVSVWEAIDDFESYKSSIHYSTSGSNGAKTFTRIRYIILPIWWSDENTSVTMDQNKVRTAFDLTKEFYDAMSFSKISDFSYTLLEQTVFTVSQNNPGFGDTSTAAREIIRNRGYVKGTDYDQIALVYNNANSGPFQGSGGWGGVNGDFLWLSYPGGSSSVEVVRHEIGHNVGHPHHTSNSYNYRFTRPNMMENGDYASPYDGFDMMSGGNNVPNNQNPDIAVASKWFFNWIPDENIVHMQPEGPTQQCPGCLSKATVTLYPFENEALVITPEKKMGIHIPIAVVERKVYSYWLSYRGTGYNGAAAGGLSVHFSWFTLGGAFGATYNSHNYDAHGDTPSTADSFVENGCYHIFPGSYMKDRDIMAVEDVQPIVCIEGIDTGNAITVNVSFLDKALLPSPQNIAKEHVLDCSTGRSEITLVDVSSNEYNVVHVRGSGNNGDVSVDICVAESNALFSAYYYDTFPHSLLTYGSNAAYGSYKRYDSSTNCPNSPGGGDYKSDYDETYIAIPPATGVPPGNTSKATVRISCTVQKCLWNSYLFGDVCKKCPADSISDEGSMSIASCKSCPGGTYLAHPLSRGCAISETYKERDPSISWRLWAPLGHSQSGWSWDLKEIKFYSSIDCSEGTLIPNDGTSFDSGNAGSSWSSNNAFRDQGIWGGRPENNFLYIGMTFSTAKKIQCIETKNPSWNDKGVYEMRIQAFNEADSTWENAYIAKNLDLAGLAVNRIKLDYNGAPSDPPQAITSSPTSLPSITNTYSPSSAPSVAVPTNTPSVRVSSKRWRLWTHEDLTASGWVWDVALITLFKSSDCSADSVIPNNGTPFDSANAGTGWGPENAFRDRWMWGGRAKDNYFYVGMSFSDAKKIQCIQMRNGDTHGVRELVVQAFDEADSTWKDVYIAKNLSQAANGVNTMQLYSPSVAPTTSPSSSPTSSPTASPSSSPTSSPTASPSSSPVEDCSEEPQAKFFFKWQGKELTKKCSWLSSITSKKKKEKACAMQNSSGEGMPPASVSNNY